METELIIQIILLAFAMYLAFFKSYLTEKGKSAALKGDLADLTHEVEKVKNEFIKEQDILKIELQRALSNEVSYQNEVRNALINLHGIISEWLYSILEVGFGDYNKSNIDLFINTRKVIASYYAKAGIAQSRVELLVEDKELVKSALDLYSASLAFYHWADKEFLFLQQNCESQKYLTDQFSVIIKDFDRNRELAESMAKDEESLRTEAKQLFDNYISKRNDEYFKVKPIEKGYSDRLKHYLKK
jgi:hypothetical protein